MRKYLLPIICVFAIGCGASPLMLIPPLVNGVIYWYEGEATKYYNADVSQAYQGIMNALAFYGHTVSSDEQRGNGREIVSHSQNHKFRIYVYQADPKVACLKIRIDFFGDKPYAELIYKKVDEHLGTKTKAIKTIQ